MKLKNETKIADKHILQIYDFVKLKGIEPKKLTIEYTKDSKAFNGFTYPKSEEITVRLNPNMKYPFYNTYYGDRLVKYVRYDMETRKEIVLRTEKETNVRLVKRAYIDGIYLSMIETLIHVMAHEIRHLWQKKHKHGKIYGSRGKYSERDADYYGFKKQREYRKLKQKLNYYYETHDLYNG